MQLKAYINVSNQTVYYASLKKCIVRKIQSILSCQLYQWKVEKTTCYKYKQYKAFIIYTRISSYNYLSGLQSLLHPPSIWAARNQGNLTSWGISPLQCKLYVSHWAFYPLYPTIQADFQNYAYTGIFNARIKIVTIVT